MALTWGKGQHPHLNLDFKVLKKDNQVLVSLEKNLMIEMILNLVYRARFVRFAAVGSAGLLTNLYIFHFGVYFFELGINISATLAFIFANFQNYLINAKWTFKGSNERVGFKEYLKFLLSSLLGLGVNLLILNLYICLFIEQTVYLGQTIGILAGTIFNYRFSKYFVFKV